MGALIGAYLEQRRWANAHSDLRDYHARRYAALAAALGANLDHPPDRGAGAEVTTPDWYPSLAKERQDRYPAAWSELGQGQEFALAGLFDSTVRQIERLGSPFDDFMEAPLVVQAFYRGHADEIRAPLAELRSRLMVLLRELTCTLWSLDPKATVSADALRAHGFDPDESGPDPIDYW